MCRMGAGASAQFGPRARRVRGQTRRRFRSQRFQHGQGGSSPIAADAAALRYQVNAQGQEAGGLLRAPPRGRAAVDALLARAVVLDRHGAAGNPNVTCPGLPFSVRCGANATSLRASLVPPDSGLLQVNNNSGACRIVRVALGTAPAYAQKTASGTFQPLTPAQNALIASAVAASSHGGKAGGPGLEIRWGTSGRRRRLAPCTNQPVGRVHPTILH